MDEHDVGPEGVSSESVEQWLQEIAAQEGLSREETLEDLVSSYWRLKEIFHLLQDSGIEVGDTHDSVDAPRTADVTEVDELRSRIEGLAKDIEEIDDESAEANRDRRVALSRLRSRLEDVEEQQSALTDELSELLNGPLGESEAVLNHLKTLERRMERNETQVSVLGEHVDGMDSRVSSIEDSSIDATQFHSYVQKAESVQEAIQQDQSELRDRVISEFGNIRSILTFLLENSGGEGPTSANLSHELEGELRVHLNDQETLNSIVRRANREGIRSAACSQCDQSVDLGLLEAPRCPHCEQRFDVIETKPRYLGLSRRHILSAVDEDRER